MAVSRNSIMRIYVEDKLDARLALDMDIRAVLCFVADPFHHQQRAAAHAQAFNPVMKTIRKAFFADALFYFLFLIFAWMEKRHLRMGSTIFR